MKKSALFILFALISVAGFSQITGWNAKVGMNISNYTGDADLNAKIGFKLGGGFEYAFDNTWSLQPSLFLSTKGAKKDGNSINAMYLELPVMAAARFNVADNTNIVAVTVVMGMARGRGKATSQISMTERMTLDEYDAVIFMLGNFKSCVETKAELMRDIHAPTVLVCGPNPEGIEGTCDAIVTGVGRKAARMRTPPERAKLDEIADITEAVLKEKKRSLL